MTTSSSATATSSKEDVIRQKDARIAVLERQKQRQVEELTLLRSEIGASQIKHKEDIYWMRLECDSLRRDKEAAEDRMEELLRDMKEMEESSQNEEELPPVIDKAYVTQITSQLNKSMQTVGILDNQISMVKKSCDEVVKSLKEEISDVMDDKCRMEMELMNQMATLDNDKRSMEIAMEEQLKQKDLQIQELKQRHGATIVSQKSSEDGSDKYCTENDDDDDAEDKNAAAADDEELVQKIKDLELAKTKLADQLVQSQKQHNNQVDKLKRWNGELTLQVDNLKHDLELLREEGAASKALSVLDHATADRQETMATLERVALIWEKADDSIRSLEHIMEELKPNDDDDDEYHVKEETERLLSTLETASLVHGQVKVALLLIELKLRNQLGSLQSDYKNKSKITNSSHAQITSKMLEIQQEAVAAMERVEDSLSDQIKQLKETAQQGQVNLEEALQSKHNEVKALKLHQQELQEEIVRLEEEKLLWNQQRSSANTNLGVSRPVMERLQQEVLTVAQRVKEKNDLIERLTSNVNEHKVRESALKKEMKRLLKRRAETKKSSNTERLATVGVN